MGIAGEGTAAGGSDPEVDSRTVLEELRKVDREWAFAESVTYEQLLDRFVGPDVYGQIVDRSTWIVVGAKGAGKTWLWRYLVNGGGSHKPLPPEMRFIVGHAPDVGADEAGHLQLSAAAFGEVERAAGMTVRGTHGAFWHLYAAARVAHALPEVASIMAGAATRTTRSAVAGLLSASTQAELREALIRLLLMPGVGAIAEDVTEALDRELLSRQRWVTLVYDGLDTGFQGGPERSWLERRNRYVTALLQVLAAKRALWRRLHLKVLLREDIYLAIDLQNKSHLDAAKTDLRWQPGDLWRMALNVACSSSAYRDIVRKLRPGIDPPWPGDEQLLESLLVPFWGRTIEKGKNAGVANYVRKRTSDAAGRLFPRTLVQVLHSAIANELRLQKFRPDRVLGFASVRVGIAEASAKRVEDLKTEYAEIKPYLNLLKGMSVTGTREQFAEHMRREAKQHARARRGLHMGPVGWLAVVDRLVNVGLLGQYKRNTPDADQQRLAVALLYRTGLGLRLAGLA